MFEKLKKKKRLKEEQRELVEFFLNEYSVDTLLAESIFTNSPYEIEIHGRPSEEVRVAVHDLGYGEFFEKEVSSLRSYPVFKANPKKFDYEKFNGYKVAYEYIVKEVNHLIDLKRKCGTSIIYKYIDSIPYFNLSCYYSIMNKLQSDFPSLEFDIHIARAFANDSLLVRGEIGKLCKEG